MEEQDSTAPAKVTVTDVDISFGNLVGLLVKVALATIPAAVIIAIIFLVIAAVLRGVG